MQRQYTHTSACGCHSRARARAPGQPFSAISAPATRRLQAHASQRSSRAVLRPRAALAADTFASTSIGALIRQRLQQARHLIISPHDKEIAAVALPAFVGLTFEPVVTAFNTSLVGHLGTHQLSAVSLGTIALNSVTFLFSFLLFLTVPEVAAAVVKQDTDEVSRVAARSIWVAVAAGVASAVLLGCHAGSVVAALKPPEPAVAALATQYLQVRALGVPLSLLSFVATGVFRGFKDTRTPLLGTGAMVVTSAVLHFLLLNVLHMDVLGAAVAATAAQLAPVCLNMWALARRGALQARHLLSPPSVAEVLPLLQRGAVLGTKNMVTFGMILFASTLCVRCGAAFQASFEVTRQFWMLTMPFFECLNVATQALCATYLGKEDRATARSLLLRLLCLGGAAGSLAGCVVWGAHEHLVALFTSDPLVVHHVVTALPLICAFFAFDALGSIMDGSLLAAKQSNYMSAVQIAGSAVQYGALMYVAQSGNVSTLSIWAAVKVMSLARTLGGALRNFASSKSAYHDAPGAVPAAPVAAAAIDAAVTASTNAETTEHQGTAAAMAPSHQPAQVAPAAAAAGDAISAHGDTIGSTAGPLAVAPDDAPLKAAATIRQGDGGAPLATAASAAVTATPQPARAAA